VLSLFDAPDIAPHPELVAIQRPSPADITLAAAVLGWKSPGYLEPDR